MAAGHAPLLALLPPQRYMATYFVYVPLKIPKSFQVVLVAHDHLDKDNENQGSKPPLLPFQQLIKVILQLSIGRCVFDYNRPLMLPQCSR